MKCNSCKLQVDHLLCDIPSKWRKQIVDVICNYVINLEIDCDQISKCLPSSQGGGSTAIYIATEIGTLEADSLGFIEGSDVYTNPLMEGRQVEIERNLLPIPDRPWNGNTYYTKELGDDFLTLSDGLINGEFIKIRIL